VCGTRVEVGMRIVPAMLCAAVVSHGAVFAQSPASPVGVTVVAGAEIPYRCTPISPGAQRFYVEASFANTDVLAGPDLPSSATTLPGLTAGATGVSSGSGAGEPIGDFTFAANWTGYQPGFVIAARRDVFSTADGDVYADELFSSDPTTTGPNLRWFGAFTFTGGTGKYRNASGSASATAQQLGDGVHSAVVACGWIDLARDP